MAASWALSVRHAIAMIASACLACVAYFVLIQAKAQELSLSDASFSALFLSNPLPSISGDIDGRLIDVNHAFISDFGYAREQLLNQSIDSLHIFESEDQRKIIARRTLGKGVIG